VHEGVEEVESSPVALQRPNPWKLPVRDLEVNLMPVKKYLKRSGGDGPW